MEHPAEKRLRKCGVKRKRRLNSDAAAQSRNFRGSRKRIPKEVRAEMRELKGKLDEIKKMEEKLQYAHQLRDRILAPGAELENQIIKAREVLEALVAKRPATFPDTSEADARIANIERAIARLKDEAVRFIAQKQVDTSPPSG